MNANELADYLHEFMFNEVDYDEDKHNQAQLMLRKQQVDLKIADDYSYILERKLKEAQAEIEFLKKEILEKHEDWKHEGQQAANARAEIEALKLHIQGLQASITLGEKYMARKNPVETLENIGAILRKAGEK